MTEPRLTERQAIVISAFTGVMVTRDLAALNQWLRPFRFAGGIGIVILRHEFSVRWALR